MTVHAGQDDLGLAGTEVTEAASLPGCTVGVRAQGIDIAAQAGVQSAEGIEVPCDARLLALQ